jgi:hypothetical protein
MSEHKRRGPGVCYSFQRGECNRGDDCRYLHETQETQGRRKTSVCYSFQRGECNRGDDCRYLHETTQRRARELPPERYVSKYARGTRYDRKQKDSKLVEPAEPTKPAWVPEPSPPGTWAALVATAANKDDDDDEMEGKFDSGSEADE